MNSLPTQTATSSTTTRNTRDRMDIAFLLNNNNTTGGYGHESMPWTEMCRGASQNNRNKIQKATTTKDEEEEEEEEEYEEYEEEADDEEEEEERDTKRKRRRFENTTDPTNNNNDNNNIYTRRRNSLPLRDLPPTPPTTTNRPKSRDNFLWSEWGPPESWWYWEPEGKPASQPPKSSYSAQQAAGNFIRVWHKPDAVISSVAKNNEHNTHNNNPPHPCHNNHNTNYNNNNTHNNHNSGFLFDTNLSSVHDNEGGLHMFSPQQDRDNHSSIPRRRKERVPKPIAYILEAAFKQNPRPTTEDKTLLAEQTGLDLARVHSWYATYIQRNFF